MSHTNDLKDQHLDQFVDWVTENKFDDMCSQMCVIKDQVEEAWEYYIESNSEELWNEYLDLIAR